MGAGRYEEGPVLVAEDDPDLLARLRDALRAEDASVIGCRSVRVAVSSAEFHRPSVVVLDLAMEDGRGWEVLHGAAAWPGIRWLALDRRGDALTRRAALAAGADDVVSAPLDTAEIAARVRSLRRRERANGSGVLRLGELVVDVASHEVRAAGRVVTLTALQFALLRALFEARGAALGRPQLLARIAGLEAEPPSERAIDLHVSRLRRRLGSPAGTYIRAVYGIGYRLATSAAQAASLSGEEAGAVLDSLGEAVLVIDAELRIRAANRAAARLLARDDLVGRGCAEVMACRGEDGVPVGTGCLGRAVLTGGGSVAEGCLVIGRGDQERRAGLSHAPVHVEGLSDLVAIAIHPRPR